MEIDITEFFNTAEPANYSASQMELGENAGRITWQAACTDSPDHMLLDNDEKREAFREWVKGYGAWTNDEIAAWSDVELNALFIQWVSGDMREAGLHAGMTADDWKTYQQACESGRVSGNIFGGPLSSDGRIYFGLY